jgi:hypothetical protein
MIRFLIRAIGYFALAGAFVSATVDGTRSIASAALTWTSIGAALERAAPAAQAWMQAGLGRVHPALWDSGAALLLRAPLALALLGLGLLLVRLAADPEPVVGYAPRD